MATGKRYYWMKLRENFMTSDTIDYFMSQQDGANYVVLYQMLCLKTINTEGRLSRKIGEIIIPYDIPKIQRDMKWFSSDTIRVALELFKAFGLIYEDVDGVLALADYHSLVGSESDYAQQKKLQRQNRRPELGVDNVHENVHTEIEIRDKRLEIESISSSLRSEDIGAGAPTEQIPPTQEPKAAKPSKTAKKEAGRFVPPTLEEVAAYAAARKSGVDPKRFYEYFSTPDAQGRTWRDSKGNPVRNWKQKFLTWEKYGSGAARSGPPAAGGGKPRQSWTELAAQMDAEEGQT